MRSTAVPHDAQHQGLCGDDGLSCHFRNSARGGGFIFLLREESAPAQKDLQSILQLLRMVSAF